MFIIKYTYNSKNKDNNVYCISFNVLKERFTILVTISACKRRRSKERFLSEKRNPNSRVGFLRVTFSFSRVWLLWYLYANHLQCNVISGNDYLFWIGDIFYIYFFFAHVCWLCFTLACFVFQYALKDKFFCCALTCFILSAAHTYRKLIGGFSRIR